MRKFRVRSRSREGLFHIVIEHDTGDYSCDCEYAGFTHKVCRHIEKVQNKMGKETSRLKEIYLDKGITSCEMKWQHDCWHDNGLSFAHRMKRRFYKSCPEKLGEFSETLLLCPVAHDMIEYSRPLTEKIFEELRGSNV